MLLSNEQVDQRLSSPDNLALRFGSGVQERIIHRPGRKTGVPNLEVVKRNEIALRSRLGELQADLASEFSTTQARVSQLERGKDKSLDEQALQQQLKEVRDIAVDKLMASMGLISDDKLSRENAQGLSRIAANMAKVMDRTLPREESQAPVNVIVYCPEQRSEKSFKTIEI